MDPILALILATLGLAAIPGPNVALIVANSLARGFLHGLMTVSGTTVGIAIQLLCVAVGYAALLEAAAGLMVWVKWAGAAYLLYLGIKAWNEPVSNLETVEADRRSGREAFWQGLGLATVNPKTLLFSAAFLPQFIPSGSTSGFVLMLALVYLVTIFAGDALWAACASSARGLLNRYGHLRGKLTGGFLMSAGVGLALTRLRN